MKILNLLLLVFIIFIHCVVATYLWNWFAVPLLGLPQLGFLAIFALTMTLSTFRGVSFRKTGVEFIDSVDKSAEDQDRESIGNMQMHIIKIFAYLTTWGIGAVVNQFI